MGEVGQESAEYASQDLGVPVHTDQLHSGMLWQVAMSVAALQKPLHVPFAQVQLTARTSTRQAFCVVAAAQSSPRTGFTMHPGVGAQPGMLWHCDARSP
jgi:hypothetical protein